MSTIAGLPAALRIDREQTDADRIANQYYAAMLELDPGHATVAGHKGRETEYADYSPAGYAARIDLIRRTYAQLEEVSPADSVDVVTIDVMRERLGLALELHEANLGEWELNPLATVVHEIRSIFDLMPQSTAEDFEHILGRMEQVPGAINGFIATLKSHATAGRVAAKRQIDLLITQTADYGKDEGFFDGLATAAIEAQPTFDGRAQQAAELAKAAYRTFSEFLATELAPLAPLQDAVGRARYALHLREFLGTEVDLEETYQWGIAELDRIIAEQRQVAEQIQPGASIEEAKAVLNNDPSRKLHGTDALREWMQELSDNAVKALAGTYFDIAGPMLELECKIAPTQDGGIYYTGPSSDFSRPGRMWWSVPPGVEEFTTWGEVSTVYHEGVPGHHLQIATATAMAESLNDYRANMVWVSGHGEGWALYAERLMEEFGYLDDWGDRMGMLDAQRLRAARVVFDIGMHCGFDIPEQWAKAIGTEGIWTAEAGLEFLRQNLDMPEGNLMFEFHRYLGWPGQAPSYKIGQRVWEDVREAALAQGKTLREFHTEALKLGNLGLDSLKRAMA